MKNDDHQEHEFSETSAADLLTDSLLKNYAANPKGSDDDDFLAGVEAAMDAEDGGRPEFASAGASTPRARRSRGRKLAWAAGIAAVLTIGFAGLAWNNQSIKKAKQTAPELVATAVPETFESPDGLMAYSESPRLLVPKREESVSLEQEAAEPVASVLLANYSAAPQSEPANRQNPGLADSLASTRVVDESIVTSEEARNKRTGRDFLLVPNGTRRNLEIQESKLPRVDPGGVTVGNAAVRYGEIVDNRWKSPFREPLSTFSIDVDTASWTNIRGMMKRGVPIGSIPKDAVRIEEMINYFDWNYPQPAGKHPFGYAVESASCPWNADNRLLRVAIQGEDVKRHRRPPANLVFLLDVSGSMNQPKKLPLVQRAISILVEELNENDCVSIVVYAGSEGVALEPTRGNEQGEILAALNRLRAGGSTNGGAGIDLAYKMAARNFNRDGVNRVILCTDGDFNVGRTGTESLVDFVEGKAKRDRVFLSVCGFGHDNLNDAMLEAITNKGNGNYYYIDGPAEARKVFLKDLTGTLVTIAKDVKIQIEFNPGQVKAYRLIGYANRQLRDVDFEDDRVDAGEIGAGHSVTAFYEIVPAGSEADPTKTTSNLRYQRTVEPDPVPEPKRKIVPSPELALLKLRYKKPDEDSSKYVEMTVMPNDRDWSKASADFRFASAVALFGLKLRGHESARDTELADIIAIARDAAGNDPHGYRAEFVELLKRADD